MRILLLADEADKMLWEHLDKRRLEGVELILSCGDLPASYLSYLTCFTAAPICYIHGNHDTRYAQKPPEGCECIDDMVFTHNGIRVLGLGGCMRYKPGEHQYTDYEMLKRVKKVHSQIRKAGGIDILLTHAPAAGVGDDGDLCHRGFETFLGVMDAYHPQLMAHGHVHQSYSAHFQRERSYNGVRVVNAFCSVAVEITPAEKQKQPFFCPLK